MTNTNASKLHILPIHCHLLAAQQEPYKKALLKKMTRQKEQEDKAENQNGDRKGEPTDSPEIPDRGEASEIPSLPLGEKKADAQLYIYNQSHTIMIHKSWHE